MGQEYSTDALLALDDENRALEKEVSDAEGRVEAFRDLEPDLNTASRQLDEKIREFDQLVQRKQEILARMVR
jgi:uncharacterized protein involved in exopolysaccharide biosynthesis